MLHIYSYNTFNRAYCTKKSYTYGQVIFEAIVLRKVKFLICLIEKKKEVLPNGTVIHVVVMTLNLKSVSNAML